MYLSGGAEAPAAPLLPASMFMPHNIRLGENCFVKILFKQ